MNSHELRAVAIDLIQNDGVKQIAEIFWQAYFDEKEKREKAARQACMVSLKSHEKAVPANAD